MRTERSPQGVDERAGVPSEPGDPSLSLLHATLDATTEGILVVDADGRIVAHNRQFAKMWRIPQEILGTGDSERVIQFVRDQLADPEAFVEGIREISASPEAEHRDLLDFKDGRVFERHAKPHVVDGHLEGWVIGCLEVTEQRQTEAALRAAEQKYRVLVEGLPAVVYLAEFGVSGQWRYVSPQIEVMLGYTPQEWMADPDLWWQRIHPEDRTMARETETRSRASGAPLGVEYRMVARDGRAVWVRDEAVVIRDDAGAPLFLQGIMYDVTERKRAEGELRRQKEELGALHETALGLIERLEPQGVLEAIVNRAAALVHADVGFLYTAERETGDLVARLGTGRFSEYVGSRLPKGEGLAGRVWAREEAVIVDDYSTWEGRHSRFEGMALRSVAGIPLRSGGEVVGVIGVGRLDVDRTFTPDEREQLERFARLASLALENARLYEAAHRELSERKQAEQRFRNIFENAVVGIYQTTIDGRFAAANPALARMFGYGSPEELTESPTDAADLYVDPAGREQFIELMRERGEATMLEYRIRRKDGKVIWVQESARALRNEAGEVVGFEGTLIDVTERKHAEEALRKAYERERQAADRLRTVDEMKNAFLAAVSHELRTPLSSILGFAMTLEREELNLASDERHEIIARMAFNARKLDRLLSDLLDLDRLNRGIVEPRCRPTDMAALVRRAVDEFEFLGTRPLEVDAEHTVLEIDGPKVERIVENLLANAAKYTPPGTPVWVRAHRYERGVLLEVEDSGPGVPDHLKGTIFEPFHHGDSESVSHAPGTGIGLSLVARFAELHGGRAWVEDRPGGGARFRVYLPGAAA